MAANGTKCSTNEECASGVCLNEVCTDKKNPRYILKRETDRVNNIRGTISGLENWRSQLQESYGRLLNRARMLEPMIGRDQATIDEIHREIRRVNNELRIVQEYRGNNPDTHKDEEGNNIYDRENALRYNLEGLSYRYKDMINNINKIITEYNNILNDLLPEREQLIKEYDQELTKLKKELKRLSDRIGDNSRVRREANAEIKRLEQEKENEKKENNQYVGTDEVIMEDIYEKDSYGKCPHCGGVFFNDTIDSVCAVATYVGDEDVEDYDYDASPEDRYTNSLFRYEKKCPLCKGSWEEFCNLSPDERRVASAESLMFSSLNVPSPSRNSGQSLSPDSPSRNTFTPSPNSVFTPISSMPVYDLLEIEYNDGSHSGRGRNYLIDRNNNIYSVITQQHLGQIGEGEFVGSAWEDIAINNPHYTSSRQPGGKKLKSKRKKATKRIKKTKGIKSCCKHTKKDKLCIRKDGKTFSLPRRFSKKKCKKPKGFTMKASCAPYKGCKN